VQLTPLAPASAALPAPALPRPPAQMSWQVFRCEVDCNADPNNCINEQLYRQQTDALVAGGYLAAGYNGIHMDDCWPAWQRDPTSGALVANSTRFPSGMKALGDYMHGKGVQFATYTAESPTTCAGYPASLDHETLDANTFASWGVDYLKVRGRQGGGPCGGGGVAEFPRLATRRTRTRAPPERAQ
jgi:hypothetical protein